MTRRAVAALLLTALVASACSGEATPAVSPPSTTATLATTTTLPTTTTTAPLVLENATPELTAVIDSFYKYARQLTDVAPEMPPDVLSQIVPSSGTAPLTGTASVATFKEAMVATVAVGTDTFLAVADGGNWRIVGGEWPSLAIPAYYGQGPRVVAIIGSDARPNETVTATRADSIHFVGLDGVGGGAVVGLPRDSYVPVPGHGKRKITGALALGGPDLLMQSLRDLTGLPFEGYLLTGFSGFEQLITSVLGGVEVVVPFAINDKNAKATLKAGQQILNGFDALAFARARKTLPGGDFTRSEHQGVILIGAAKGVRSLGMSALPGLLEASEPYLFTDLTAEQLLTFAAMSIASDLDNMPNIVAPGSAGSAGGASVVFLSSSSPALFSDLADGRLDN